MTHIKTVRHDIVSMFQGVAEDVAVKLDRQAGTASEERGTTLGARPNLNHPVVAAAAGISELHEAGQDVPEAAPQELVDHHGGAAETAWTCARLAAELLEARLKRNSKRAQELEDELKFSTCDPAWSEAIAEYVDYFGPDGKKRDIPYIRYQEMGDFVLETVPPDATIAVVGDWGTGTPEAIRVLEQIRDHRPDVLVHLGDVYYSGTPKECKKYFLDVLNRVLERDKNPIPVYTLTGNHDMYAGGVGYYQLLPKLNPSPPFEAAQAQPASYFALRTTDGAWQFLGMDTGLHDHDPFTVSDNITYLEEDEEAWHVDKIRRFSAAGGRTILLSHHQLFSAFSAIGKVGDRAPAEQAVNPKLMASYRKFQEAGDIAAWFWGHEHNLDVYQPYEGLAKGRCVGHGAIPEFVETGPYDVIDGLADPPRLVEDPRKPGKGLMLDRDDRVFAHGFVILRLDDKQRTATASYYQDTEPGVAMYEETL